ncbi:hypothetical protein FA15DRAFT_156768 [Coprinopsis marcescibilis]|uniref:Uncharacterized protein n=1 Tax=Coprinopsis marcescibilis TaxID=230819 RepID=A0A5C3KI59_COPMA|nr:hypothetical protein FA15DRAFT_156768 [Coprinopsis marcescibilis]
MRWESYQFVRFRVVLFSQVRFFVKLYILSTCGGFVFWSVVRVGVGMPSFLILTYVISEFCSASSATSDLAGRAVEASGAAVASGNGSDGGGVFVDRKLYLIVVFVGLLVVVVLAIMLSAWCCKGELSFISGCRVSISIPISISISISIFISISVLYLPPSALYVPRASSSQCPSSAGAYLGLSPARSQQGFTIP